MPVPTLKVEGPYVRALRDAHGYTLRTFASALQMDERQLGHIERGGRQPTPLQRVRIAKKLGVPQIALVDATAFEAAFRRATESVAA